MYLEPIFLINLSASVFLCGLIWVIQLVHYPSFHFVDEAQFNEFHQFHGKKISYLVIPLMIIELISSSVLAWHSSLLSLQGLGFVLVAGTWFSTFIFSVPYHSKLEKGKNEEYIRGLINSNWVRTFLWTTKAVLSVLILINN